MQIRNSSDQAAGDQAAGDRAAGDVRHAKLAAQPSNTSPTAWLRKRPTTWIALAAFAAALVPASVPMLLPARVNADTPKAAPPASNLFTPIAAVLRDPRCMNCHPRDDAPRQRDIRRIHQQSVTRGPDGLGFFNNRCYACHRDENNTHSGVPGAPNWHLAPLSMGWDGLDDGALCTTLKDESKNGGRDVAALIEHMTSDALVLWGWKPGGDLTPVSVPHDTFVANLKAWAGAGAPCPQVN